MVGIRGIVAQGLGMALYVWTGHFAWPLLIAAAGFLWAAHRMNALARATHDHPIHKKPLEVAVPPLDATD